MRLSFRAIVIDDMEFCRDVLSEFLKDRGYQVLSYPDVTACPLFTAREVKCPAPTACADFLLTDNRMPHMVGLDFIELLQGNCPLNSQRRAIFSASWSLGELKRAEQLSCKSFNKPYDFDLLANWLDSHEKQIPANRTLSDIDTLTSLDRS